MQLYKDTPEKDKFNIIGLKYNNSTQKVELLGFENI